MVERLWFNLTHAFQFLLFTKKSQKIDRSRTSETKFILKEKVLTGCRCDTSRVKS